MVPFLKKTYKLPILLTVMSGTFCFQSTQGNQVLAQIGTSLNIAHLCIDFVFCIADKYESKYLKNPRLGWMPN